MEIWIVEKGEKQGPFEAYEVRGRIEEARLTGDELAWHKDQEGWVALREMDIFRSAFEESREVPDSPPPVPPGPPFPYRRFFARWFDIYLYLLLLCSVVRFSGYDLLDAMMSSWAMFSLLPFVLLEAIVLHLTKTTPGKFLLGLRVVGPEEEALSLRAALVRSLRVYILGLGLMPCFGVLTGICHVYCIWYLMRRNEAPWDAASQNRVRAARLLPFRIVVFGMLFTGILLLFSAVLGPASVEFWEQVRESAERAD
jgi:hypothetical protein